MSRRPPLFLSHGPGASLRFGLLAFAIVAATWSAAAQASEPQHCVRAAIVLWGDGRHDDSAALNAWFDGEAAVWAESGEPVGTSITGHDFRLTAPLYVSAGTGRRLDDFRLLWPARGEIVSGGSIASGSDPEKAPILSGVQIIGGDPGEGTPFEAPDQPRSGHDDRASCAIS